MSTVSRAKVESHPEQTACFPFRLLHLALLISLTSDERLWPVRIALYLDLCTLPSRKTGCLTSGVANVRPHGGKQAMERLERAKATKAAPMLQRRPEPAADKAAQITDTCGQVQVERRKSRRG